MKKVRIAAAIIAATLTAGMITADLTKESMPTNAGMTTTESTKETELNNAGTKETERLRIQSNNNQSSVAHAATQTPAPTVQSTNQVPRNGNNVQPAAHGSTSISKAQTVSTPKVDGDLISAQAEDFTGNELPVTGSKDTFGTILTCFGIAFVIWAGLHAIWIITAPRKRRKK